MDKTQEEKFEIWWASNEVFRCFDEETKERYRATWDMALRSSRMVEDPRIPDTVIEVGGYFKIDWNSRPWATEVRVGYASKDMRPDAIGDRIVTIPRPVPVWKPKDGEAVIFEYGGITLIGTFHKGFVYCESHVYPHSEDKCRPVDYDMIGNPWSDI